MTMPRTMNLWVLVGVAAALLIGFIVYGSGLQANVNELDEIYEQSKARLVSLKNEQTELNSTLELAGTDAFIENQARTLYGYMMPDEIRFVITNPEALYGDDEVPSR